MTYMCNLKTMHIYCHQILFQIIVSSLVMFDLEENSEERCLSLHCFANDKRFIRQKCSQNLDRVCANMSKFLF